MRTPDFAELRRRAAPIEAQWQRGLAAYRAAFH